MSGNTTRRSVLQSIAATVSSAAAAHALPIQPSQSAPMIGVPFQPHGGKIRMGLIGAGLRGNGLGYSGHEFQQEKRPGVLRIAALGDSFALGPAVPFAANYLTLLERQR